MSGMTEHVEKLILDGFQEWARGLRRQPGADLPPHAAPDLAE